MESLPAPKSTRVVSHPIVAYATPLCTEMWFNGLQGHLGPREKSSSAIYPSGAGSFLLSFSICKMGKRVSIPKGHQMQIKGDGICKEPNKCPGLDKW